MAKKIYTVTASCIALILSLTIVEPRGASAINEQPQQEHRHTANRRHPRRAARKKAHRPHAVSYVCPMHPDMRANSPGTCPKCLMELVRKDAKPARRS
jgi:hypothetical protein